MRVGAAERAEIVVIVQPHELELGAARAACALLPAANRIGADVEESCEKHLDRVKRVPDLSNIFRPHLARRRRHFGHAEINGFPTLKGKCAWSDVRRSSNTSSFVFSIALSMNAATKMTAKSKRGPSSATADSG